MEKPNSLFRPMTLRQKIVALSIGLISLSALGFALSLYQISGVRDLHDHLNQVLVPTGRILTQLKSDSDLHRRETERGLSMNRWGERNWTARSIPPWLDEVLDYELKEIQKLLALNTTWAIPEAHSVFRQWLATTMDYRVRYRQATEKVLQALKSGQTNDATEFYPEMTRNGEAFYRQVHWGVDEYDRLFRSTFEETEKRVDEFKTAFQMVIFVVLSSSLLLLWYGQRALKPLKVVTDFVREVAARGFKKEDKDYLLQIPVSETPELGQLTLEFHRMATSLMERERMIENQKTRLEQQNHQLRELGELQDRLRQTEHLAAVGRLSAQVAHEVRNPLHSIGLEAEMALESVEKGKSAKESLQSILKAVDRLEKITENYLKLSKLSSGKKTVFDMAVLLESVLATYSPVFQSHAIQVDWTLDEGGRGFLVFGDMELIEQAIGNLVKNAVQALEESAKKEIRFHLGREAKNVVLKILDSGPGVSVSIRDRLFTPFATTKAQGTGLGLSFVKQVIEEHQGKIECDTLQEQGASFKVVLPHSRPQENRNEGIQNANFISG